MPHKSGIMVQKFFPIISVNEKRNQQEDTRNYQNVWVNTEI